MNIRRIISKFMENTMIVFKFIKIINLFNRQSVYLGGNKILTQTVYGARMMLDSRDLSLTPNLVTFGLWEPNITQVFLKSISEGMKVLEIGANVGYFTLLATSKVGAKGKVYAFEANPSTYETLHNNMDINGLLGNAHLVNKAVYSESKKLNFHSLSKHQGGSSLVTFHDDTLSFFNDSVEIIEVDAVSLDDYFKNGYPVINFMKIDAEGSEPHIFKGMEKLLLNCPDLIVVCEFNSLLIKGMGSDPLEFLNYLQKSGFKIQLISEKGQVVDCNISEISDKTMCELFLTKKI